MYGEKISKCSRAEIPHEVKLYMKIDITFFIRKYKKICSQSKGEEL